MTRLGISLTRHPSESDFTRDGYAVFPAAIPSEEIITWQKECDRLWVDQGISSADRFRVDGRRTLSGDFVRERLDPVSDASPIFSALARDERITGIASSLLGEDVRLFKDKLIVKEPGTLGYELHQDFAYVSDLGFTGHQQLAIVIALDPADEANGAIEVIPGLHRQLLRGRVENPFLVEPEAVSGHKTRRIVMDPGDVLALHSLCPHCSAPNRSNHARRILFFTYNTISCGDLYETYYRLGKP